MNIKKIIVILVGLFLLIIIFLGVFVLTYDVDRLRPVIEEHVSQSIGKKVSLGKISLIWKGAFALKLKQVVIYPSHKAQTEPLLTLDSVDAALDFWPLLQRKVRIGSVLIRKPHLQLVQKSGGTLKGFEPQTTKPSASSSSTSKKSVSIAPAALSFLVQRVGIEDGSISYRDEAQPKAAEWFVRNIDLKIEGVSFDQNMPIEAQAVFLSDKQNINLKGTAFFSTRDNQLTLKQMRLVTDLNQVKSAYLTSALGRAAQGAKLGGSFVMELLRPLDLSPFDDGKLSAQISLTDGKFSESSEVPPLNDMNLDARISGTSLALRNFSAKFAGGDLKGSGTVANLTAQPSTSFHVNVTGMNLDQLIPPAGPSEPTLEGRGDAVFEGSFVGTAWPRIARSLEGQGQLSIRNGIIRNFNMVREVFNRLSLFPKLVEKLQSELPPSYEEKLNARDTALSPIDIPFSVSGGILRIPQAVVTSNTFSLTGAGSAVLTGGLQMRAMLSIDPDLSQAMIKRVNELQYLTDDRGQIGIPIIVEGVLPHVKVIPDLSYVGSKLAVAKTTEWVGGLVQKKIGQKNSDTQPVTTGQEPQTTPLENILGQLLGGSKKSTTNTN